MSEGKEKGGKTWVWVNRIGCLLLIGLPILGLAGSLVWLGTSHTRPVGRWESLGSPPETPTAFVDADLAYVYVRGQDGSLLECKHSDRTADDDCWKRVEQPRQTSGSVEHGRPYWGARPPQRMQEI